MKCSFTLPQRNDPVLAQFEQLPDLSGERGYANYLPCDGEWHGVDSPRQHRWQVQRRFRRGIRDPGRQTTVFLVSGTYWTDIRLKPDWFARRQLLRLVCDHVVVAPLPTD